MNYQLSSTRDIGDMKQKVIVNINDCGIASMSNRIALMQKWIQEMELLDYNGRINGVPKYKGLIESKNEENTNYGTKGDVLFTVKYLGTGATVPKMVSTRVNDVTCTTGSTTGTATTQMNEAYLRMVGLNINTQYCYVTNVIVNLHN